MFCEDSQGAVQFHEATHLTASDWGQLRQTARHRVLGYFHRQGLLERHVTDDMLTWQASARFSIDASVHIPGRDRAGEVEFELRESEKRLPAANVLRA